jgi:hypothetical protein
VIDGSKKNSKQIDFQWTLKDKANRTCPYVNYVKVMVMDTKQIKKKNCWKKQILFYFILNKNKLNFKIYINDKTMSF